MIVGRFPLSLPHLYISLSLYTDRDTTLQKLPPSSSRFKQSIKQQIEDTYGLQLRLAASLGVLGVALALGGGFGSLWMIFMLSLIRRNQVAGRFTLGGRTSRRVSNSERLTFPMMNVVISK